MTFNSDFRTFCVGAVITALFLSQFGEHAFDVNTMRNKIFIDFIISIIGGLVALGIVKLFSEAIPKPIFS